jgi:hypothetical protein
MIIYLNIRLKRTKLKALIGSLITLLVWSLINEYSVYLYYYRFPKFYTSYQKICQIFIEILQLTFRIIILISDFPQLTVFLIKCKNCFAFDLIHLKDAFLATDMPENHTITKTDFFSFFIRG